MEVREEPKETLTYRDTFDWRLQRAGLTLTTSPVGRRARISLITPDGRVVDSVVPRVPRFVSDLPPGPVRKIVQTLVKHRRFLPRARAEWKGTLVAVLNEDRKTVVRFRLREGEASDSDGPGTIRLLPRLQCLPLKGYRSEEREVTSFLKKTFKLKTEARAEVAAVYDAVGQTPGDYSSAFHLALDPEIEAAEATRRIQQTLLQTILANREGVTRDWDTEFLHDFRVALRRTRSLLTQLKGVYPDSAVSHYGGEFRWLGGLTGPTRDLDVYLLNIPAYRAALTEGARDDLEPLLQFLEKKKKTEHGLLLEALGSERFSDLMGGWQTLLVNPQADDPRLLNARRPIREVASERIWRAYEKVLTKGRKAGRETSAEALHRLRIDCKKLRYLLTFFRSLFPAEALNPILKELKKLQDHLGAFNDLQVQREAIKSSAEEMMATETGPPPTLLAMGQLMGQLETHQGLERDAFRKRFRRFFRPANQARFQTLFGPDPETESVPTTGKGPS